MTNNDIQEKIRKMRVLLQKIHILLSDDDMLFLKENIIASVDRRKYKIS